MIEIRPMTQMEYDAYQDYLEELQDKKTKDAKLIRKLINYVCEKIYGMDLNAKENTPALCMYVFNETTKVTNDLNEEEIKNLVKSGHGVSEAE